MKNHPLAHFRKPPVVETSLGILFSELPDWRAVHYGALWERFKDRYPKVEYRPLMIQPTGEPIRSLQFSTDAGKIPLRVCFVDATNTQLVQVQNGYFLHNWRKTDETPEYQHYDAIRPIFLSDWRLFCRFLQENSLQNPEITRCDVTYFNHLVRGEDWQEFSDMAKIFPAWKGLAAGEPISEAKMLSFTVLYDQPNGMVQFNAAPGVRQADGKEVLQFTVTAWAEPKGSRDDQLFECLDSCHRSAVFGFLKFTSEYIQQIWEKA